MREERFPILGDGYEFWSRHRLQRNGRASQRGKSQLREFYNHRPGGSLQSRRKRVASYRSRGRAWLRAGNERKKFGLCSKMKQDEISRARIKEKGELSVKIRGGEKRKNTRKKRAETPSLGAHLSYRERFSRLVERV